MEKYGTWEFNIKISNKNQIVKVHRIEYDPVAFCFRGEDWEAPCKLTPNVHYGVKFTGNTLEIKSEKETKFTKIKIIRS